MSQPDFYAALLSNEPTPPPGLTTWNGSDPAARFAVYRNNVLSSLTDALADSFPVVQELVGEEFFRAMARVFIQSQPPSSPLLVQYGEQFPAFIEGFEPASQVPYLADVARLEALRVRAYHAADAEPLSHDQLAAGLSNPAHLVLGLHPSLHLLSSAFAVRSLWAAHQGELAIEGIDPYQPEHCLVLRQHLDVLVIGLDAPSIRFIACLHAGQSLGDAAAHCPPGFDLSACLALLISHGAITSLSIPALDE
jgi:hypothetical protein